MIVEIKKPFLESNEKILFQIKEGICSRGCSYCYEKRKPIGEMPFDVLEHGLKTLGTLGVNEAELIGSEPTEYSRWDDLITLATEQNIDLTVYTSGLHFDRLNNERVKKLILHIMFKPDAKFMEEIKKLLDKGQFIYLRVNFDATNLGEKDIILSFLEQLPEQYHRQISLKYSFTSKTDDPDIEFTDIDALKKIKPNFLEFCEYLHDKFPSVTMYSERPVFKCCFTPEELEKYSYAGLDFKCNMEYTIYKDGKIGLCPPVENIITKRSVNDEHELVRAINKIREEMNDLVKKPSFESCAKCEFLHDSSCQGGCFSYKL
jgi:organic radical activating enzyme